MQVVELKVPEGFEPSVTVPVGVVGLVLVSLTVTVHVVGALTAVGDVQVTEVEVGATTFKGSQGLVAPLLLLSPL